MPRKANWHVSGRRSGQEHASLSGTRGCELVLAYHLPAEFSRDSICDVGWPAALPQWNALRTTLSAADKSGTDFALGMPKEVVEEQGTRASTGRPRH